MNNGPRLSHGAGCLHPGAEYGIISGRGGRDMSSIHQDNGTILARLSGYLCADARAITPEAIAEMTALSLTGLFPAQRTEK